jgi:hypothetical protein
MELKQYLVTKDINDNDVLSIQTNDNNTKIIASKVKIKSKAGQKAMQAKERIENSYNSSIDRGNAKKAFYNKHKKPVVRG